MKAYRGSSLLRHSLNLDIRQKLVITITPLPLSVGKITPYIYRRATGYDLQNVWALLKKTKVSYAEENRTSDIPVRIVVSTPTTLYWLHIKCSEGYNS